MTSLPDHRTEPNVLSRLRDPTYDPSDGESTHIRLILHDLSQEHAQLQREKIAALDLLAQIDQRLLDLETEIADCRRAVARARLDRFPPEILTQIFILALPDNSAAIPSHNEAPVSISRVSRYFREVALGVPYLWSAMTLDISRRPRFDENLWMARMAPDPSCLASLRILGQPFIREFRSIITPHIHRIRHLELCTPAPQLALFLGPAADALHSLTFIHDSIAVSSGFPKAPYLAAPNLKSLEIRSGETLERTLILSHLALEVKNLTTLNMTGIRCQFSDVLYVLSECSALSALDAALAPVDGEYWETAESDLGAGGISLPHLHTLALRINGALDLTAILPHLSTPILESFELTFENIFDADIVYHLATSLSDFQAMSGLNLQHLTITNMPLDFEAGHALPSFPSLRTLTIVGYEPTEQPPTWLYERPSDSFLPLLEEIEITVGENVDMWVACALNAARFRGPLMRLSLPTSGPRSLKRISISNEDVEMPENNFYEYRVPLHWQRRLTEFAANGLTIDIAPYNNDEEFECDTFPDPWPQDRELEPCNDPEPDRIARPLLDMA
ncbi:hypothetical protein FB451DRAFT_366696 [Mycena latifolia]|nr:hypothetical protein FB451DRAFT_366696 [Mycena latifolia]